MPGCGLLRRQICLVAQAPGRSRVVDRRFVFGDAEREKFRTSMRMYENFSGCRVLSYCVMSNHFHILPEVHCEAVEHQRRAGCGARGTRGLRCDCRGVKWRAFHDINLMSIDHKPFAASNRPAADCGLAGPIAPTHMTAATRPILTPPRVRRRASVRRRRGRPGRIGSSGTRTHGRGRCFPADRRCNGCGRDRVDRH